MVDVSVAPCHRGINAAQADFPALHSAAHAELQNHTGELNHTHQNLPSCKEKHTSSQHKTSYKPLSELSSARITPGHKLQSCPEEQLRENRQQQESKPCPCLRMVNQQSQTGFLFGELIPATFTLQVAPSSTVPLLLLFPTWIWCGY